MSEHKFRPEITNGGACFCDCSCGRSFGVFADRRAAKAAHTVHLNGEEPTGQLKTRLEFGGPIVGQGGE